MQEISSSSSQYRYKLKSQPSFLSQSFHGSRRHLQKLAKNALAIVTELGKPTLFLTVTCNPKWHDITSRLLEGQTAFDRPDITVPVFHAKLTALINNLKYQKYFREELVYEMRSIEYQHRGMLHAHIVIQLKDVPHNANGFIESSWIDANLSAEMPITQDNLISDEEKEYARKVRMHMKHHCCTAVNGCLDKDGRCKKGYHDTVIADTSFTKQNGRVVYRRRHESDLLIVPHNRKILQDWDGHAYLDICSTETVIYLYKYLYKGSKKDKLKLTNADDVRDDDEINLYFRARILSSMDATWRTFGYFTYPSPTPSVILIKAMLPEAVQFFQEKKKVTKLLLYFQRPQCLQHLKFCDFHNQFMISVKLSNTLKLSREYFVVNVAGCGEYFYYRRDKNTYDCITRMEMLYPTAGEIFFLRLILLNRAVHSFRDAKTVNGVYYNTFQLAAVAANLLSSSNEVKCIFRDASISGSGHELRLMFTLLTLQGFPTLQYLDNSEIVKMMTCDYQFSAYIIKSKESFFNELLKDIAVILQENGRTLEDFGFPIPLNITTEMQRHMLKYGDVEQQQKILQQLNNTSPNTADQEAIWQAITKSISNNESKIYLIQARGGAGKTTLAKKLIAFARSMHKIVVGCASTGLAATNYDGFETAHSLFCFPVIEDQDKDESDPPKCNFDSKSGRKELLDASKVIVWDEFFSNHKELYESAYHSLQEFKGKVVICLGDIRQILPVVKYATISEQLNSCITTSPLWNKFQIMTLTTNMRLQNMLQNFEKTYANGIPCAINEVIDHAK